MMQQDAFFRRIAVWRDTKLRAPPLSGPAAVKYVHDENAAPPAKRFARTHVSVVDEDTIDCARRFVGMRPLVLNLGDDCFPGGCVDVGSGAQEESLFRRTNYFRSLTLAYFPIRANEAVYSPSITVFKEGEDADFKDCVQPFALDFVSCPGLRHPLLTAEGRLREEDENTLLKKIELVFQVALAHGHDVLVLGATGCGAWKNPPHDVAAAYNRMLAKYDGVFRSVVFAVKSGASKGYIVLSRDRAASNYDVFSQAIRQT